MLDSKPFFGYIVGRWREFWQGIECMSTSSETIRKSPTKLTYNEYVLFPDDGNRHEIIDGRH